MSLTRTNKEKETEAKSEARYLNGILEDCICEVNRRFGKNARAILGPMLFEAALNQQVLLYLNRMDDTIRPDRIVQTMRGVYSLVIDYLNAE